MKDISVKSTIVIKNTELSSFILKGTIDTLRPDDIIKFKKVEFPGLNDTILILELKVIEGNKPKRCTSHVFNYEETGDDVTKYKEVTIRFEDKKSPITIDINRKTITPTNHFFDMLEGVWENKVDNEWQLSWGWSFITQPKRNNPTIQDIKIQSDQMKEKFKIRYDQMKETITFKKLGIDRNISISGEAAFWEGMAYDISITNEKNESIHHEMGHFLMQVIDPEYSISNLEKSKAFRGQARIPVRPNGDVLKGFIIRQASIPRANTFMTRGVLHRASLENMIEDGNSSFYSAAAESLDPDFQLEIDAAITQTQQTVSSLGGPDLRSPLEWMLKVLAEEKEGNDWEFKFRHDSRNPNDDSNMTNGQQVPNPVGIGKLLSDFWIGKRKINGNSKEILQYAQKVKIKFNDVEWPHVALNTLIKQ